MSKSLSSQQSTSQSSSGTSRSNPKSAPSNSDRNSAVQALNDAQKNPPGAKLDFKRTPIPGVIPLLGATAYTTTTIGGSLSAKKVGSTNPVGVSNSGVSYEGKNGEAEVGADGSVGVEASATLNGIKNSVKVSFEGGKPVVSFGVAGSFGAVKVGTKEVKYFPVSQKRLKLSMVSRLLGTCHIPWK